MSGIVPIIMPRWGLTMEEGALTQWLVPVGERVEAGVDIAEVESTKLAGTVEATASGTIRRQIISAGTTLPVGALLGIIANNDITEADIDSFVASFIVVEKEAEDEATFTPQIIDVNGRRISYLRKGAGSIPILFVHGFGGNAASWGFIQEALAADHDTIAVDLPGHGSSSKDIGAASLTEQADFLRAFIRALNLESVHLVGHSMGGGICLALQAIEPGITASLTLLAPMGLGVEINSEYLHSFTEAQRRREVEATLKTLFANERLARGILAEGVLTYKRLDGVTEALRTIQDAILLQGRQALDLRPVLSGLSIPVLLIAGDEDRIIPSRHIAEQGGIVIAAVGHMPQTEAAERVLQEIRCHNLKSDFY